jgi:hypothetical protein
MLEPIVERTNNRSVLSDHRPDWPLILPALFAQQQEEWLRSSSIIHASFQTLRLCLEK